MLLEENAKDLEPNLTDKIMQSEYLLNRFNRIFENEQDVGSIKSKNLVNLEQHLI